MLKTMALMLVFVIHQSVCLATIFFPLPFEKQVEEASSAVEVSLASRKVFKNAIGTIMTEYSFDVHEAFNLGEGDLDHEKLKLTMPGGTFEGITSMIDGAPQFSKDEKSFLLLKKIESKIYLSNFTLGKFKIEEQDGKTFYVSEVFPTDPLVGKITKDKMVELMKTKWKTSFSGLPESRFEPAGEISPKNITALFKSGGDRRQPAQEEMKNEVPLFFWGSIGVLFFFFSLIFFKLGKSEHQHKRD